MDQKPKVLTNKEDNGRFADRNLAVGVAESAEKGKTIRITDMIGFEDGLVCIIYWIEDSSFNDLDNDM